MSRIKCLIIDDEPHTASVLESYIGELDKLEHVGTFYHAIDGLMYLQRNKIDLLFLDILLPKVTGEAFLRMLPCRPRVILLSNKKRKWVPGDDDYILGCLVKPVAFEDFLEHIERCFAAIPAVKRSSRTRGKRKAADRGPFIFLFSGKSVVKVFLQEVIYIEGVRNFAKIRTAEKEITIYQGMSSIETHFAGKGFMRIHRSLIVAIDRVTAFSGQTIEIGTHILPVSAPYRERVARTIRAGLRDV
ncbi:two component transcriptional regulator, LytTR family [Dyadobacter sp. SG02]|uniref:LytR/AlgR family response regulator transcription factor n=1 Tax=Dyadobacter sp. SG02 TaxID=1855291 RepID=UPI0008C09626|nr:LytTR family transcriptional regulator DNA-binding domain-containing protein [Dyadobacter sp. SG02]SEJ00339.1 two component transcriptional regulator, LytTR family [Dyadobacter sp. SG02]